jgi:hypothetical protein
LAVSHLIDQWLKRRAARFTERVEIVGNISIWPFIRQAAYENFEAKARPEPQGMT